MSPSNLKPLRGIITAIIRLVVFKKLGHDRDFYWSSTDTVMWTVIEPGIYLIASCLPSLRSLFTPVFKKISLSTFRARFRSSLPSKSFLNSSIRGTKPSRMSYAMDSIAPAKETDSVRCFSRLDGPWNTEVMNDGEPRSSVSCYRTRSVIYEANGESAAGNDQRPPPQVDMTTNPFVIRVQKTTSLSSEPRMAKLIA
jgi:hypothetical protein